jgi:osmotically-inducible protein OsmY
MNEQPPPLAMDTYDTHQRSRRSPKNRSWVGLPVLLAILSLIAPVTAPAQQPTDSAIARHVREELLLDNVVSLLGDTLPGAHGSTDTGIVVAVEDGVVTLSGATTNIVARRRAELLAETVRGVRSVRNLIAVSPIRRDDDSVREDVIAALRGNPATEAYEIEVEVIDGRVVLSGTVDSGRERDLAARTGGSVWGVVELDNEIQVFPRNDRLDSEIEAEVEESLNWNVYIRDGLLDVDVADGIVFLSGTVGSAAELRLARQEAWVAGVRGVDVAGLEVDGEVGRIELTGELPARSAAPSALTRAVRAALARDPQLSGRSVTVNTDGDFVRLGGVVDTLKERRAAGQAARNIVGVDRVHNAIRIERGDGSSVEDAIRLAVLRDPYLGRFDIRVRQVGDTISLDGEVETAFEKVLAEDIASMFRGVRVVANHLSVEADIPPVAYDPYVEQDSDGDEQDIGSDHAVGAGRRSPDRTDAEILDQIEYELWWSPFVDQDEIEVEVIEGRAVLTGVARSWPEVRAAIANAYRGGANIVESRIIVE